VLLHVLHQQLHLHLVVTINQMISIPVDAPDREPRPQCSAAEAEPLERLPQLLAADLAVAIGVNSFDPLLELLLAGEITFTARARVRYDMYCHY